MVTEQQHPAVAHLTGALDRAETMAREANPGQWPDPHALAAWHPAVVLRMAAADRELLAQHTPGLLGECTEDHRDSPCPTVLNRAKAWGWEGE